MSKPILCFGEILIDFLQTSHVVSDGLELPQFTQYPGGAPANVAVALAKLGAEVSMLGQLGNDQFGEALNQALISYGVDCQHVHWHPTAPTPLAFVSLDESGERHFTFHRHQSADLLFHQSQIPDLSPWSGGWLHLCSNTLTEAGIRAVTFNLVEQARAQGIGISFDVNLRSRLWAAGEDFSAPIARMLELADIVKVSREELEQVFVVDAKASLHHHCFEHHTQAVFLTDGGGAIELITKERTEVLQTPKVVVVDTTAAGDAFSGGLLYALCREPFSKGIAYGELLKACKLAMQCGAFAVQARGAFPSLPGANDISF